MKVIKKKNVLKMLAVTTAVTCAVALSISACGKKDKVNDNQDPLTGQDTSQSSEATENSSGDGENGDANGDGSNGNGDFSDFDAMIGDEGTDPNSIMDYINTNIVSAGAADVERFFSGLLSFGDDIRNIDFTGLNDSRQYMPEDMVAFMDLMKLEHETPSMAMSDEENRKVINMTLSEMLERALLFEKHLEKYPNHVTTDAASRLYEEIATNAISGGYNSAEGIKHYYHGDTEDVVDKEALQYYQKFAEANPDSNLGKIVKDYITVLESNQFQINGAMEDFYMGLHGKLNVRNQNGNNANTGTGAEQNGTGNSSESNETNESGTNGSGTAGNATADAADTVIEGTIKR